MWQPLAGSKANRMPTALETTPIDDILAAKYQGMF
jgi:hypothetical protein